MRQISLIQFPYFPDWCLERDNTLSILSPEILLDSLADN